MERFGDRRFSGPALAVWPFILMAFVVAIGGCASAPPPAIPEVQPVRPRPEPKKLSGFTEAVAAGEMAWNSVPEDLRLATRFTNTGRKKRVSEMSASFAALRRSFNAPFEYDFRPEDQFTANSHDRGWAWLMRGLAWKTELALADEDYSAAAEASGMAIRLGVRLMGGDVGDAAIGFSAISQHIQLLNPHLKAMPLRSLDLLGEAVDQALREIPSPEVTLGNQLDTAMNSLEDLRRAYVEGGSDAFEKAAGKGVGRPATWLDSNPQKRPWFFGQLRDEAIKIHQIFLDKASMPVKVQPPGDPLDPEDKMWLVPGEKRKYQRRPWAIVLARVMASHRVYARAYPEALAQLRLLAATSRIESSLRRNGAAPETLKFLPEGDRIDPFTGANLGYSAAGAQYRLWSAGPDGENDGGLIDLGPASRDMALGAEAAS